MGRLTHTRFSGAAACEGGVGRGGHTGLGPPHFVTMGESLSLPGCFCPKLLVPERLQALGVSKGG